MGKRECRAKVKILFVSSSLASPGDRPQRTVGSHFSQSKKRVIQNVREQKKESPAIAPKRLLI
jgi:hypothetical protein